MSYLADCSVCKKMYETTKKDISTNYDNNTLDKMICPECKRKDHAMTQDEHIKILESTIESMTTIITCKDALIRQQEARIKQLESIVTHN